MKKSSEKAFKKIVNTLYDNSMGDFNSMVFSFIDEMSLQNKFEEFLVDTFTGEAYEVGYNDGVSRLPHDRRYKKLPVLFEHYHQGYLAGRRGE